MICPKISVILPTFNRASTLKRAIDSVLSQSFGDFELIIIDDASTNNTSEIINSYDDPRICYIRRSVNSKKTKENARNDGLKISRGKYIAYIDSDNGWLKDHLKVLYGFLERNKDIEMVYCDSWIWRGHKKKIERSHDFDRNALIKNNFIDTGEAMHRKSCIKKTGLWNYDNYKEDDWDFFRRIAEHCKIKHIRKPLSNYYSDESVSIIMPVLNNLRYTKECVAALKKNTTLAYELIVVDDGSTDGTKKYLRSLKNIKVVTNEKNFGFAKACNRGAKLAETEYLLFLNNDTLPQKGWLRAMLDVFKNYNNVGIVGSKLVYPDTNKIQHAGVVFSKKKIPYQIYVGLESDHPAVNYTRKVSAVIGASMLIKKDDFFHINMFDEKYLNGYEDFDLCMKIRKKGKKVFYCHRSMLFHRHSATLKKLKGRNTVAQNFKYFVEKWGKEITQDDFLYYSRDGHILDSNPLFRHHLACDFYKNALANAEYFFDKASKRILFNKKIDNHTIRLLQRSIEISKKYFRNEKEEGYTIAKKIEDTAKMIIEFKNREEVWKLICIPSR